MKLRKLKLNEASKAELNEREMCRVLGGGTPGCCQCGCNYEGKPVALVLVLMIVPIMLMGIHQMVLIHVVLLLTPNRNFLK
ncbi:TIGR04149 family rSAM-modified RiPP [Bacteroides fragilis]|nr:TIGR04149 family rSAM-modified RiPP [Bacteroides fragilis]